MSARPLYRMVKDHIREQIDSGALAVHDRAPSESQLVDMLGVSRMTANRALNELAKEGLLVRIAGSGTFVADRRARGDMLALRDIAVELAESGHAHEMAPLTRETVRASREVAKDFGLKPGARLIRALVLHKRDGSPVLLEDRLVNAAIAPGYDEIDFTRETSHQFLMQAASPQKVEHRVRAVGATAEIARRLQVKPGAPCLVVRRRTWARGAVASLATLTYAGDRYEISGVFSAGDTAAV